MSTPEPRPIYRVAELAAFLGWSEETIRREIKAGHLRARKLRADTVIRHADLLDWIDNLPLDPDFATIEESEPSAPASPITSQRSAATGRGQVVRRFPIVREVAR